MGRKLMSAEQREINRKETIKKYQQSESYKDYKRRYWIKKNEDEPKIKLNKKVLSVDGVAI